MLHDFCIGYFRCQFLALCVALPPLLTLAFKCGWWLALWVITVPVLIEAARLWMPEILD